MHYEITNKKWTQHNYGQVKHILAELNGKIELQGIGMETGRGKGYNEKQVKLKNRERGNW